MQFTITIASAMVATKLKLKAPVVFCLTLPPIAGASALYALGRTPELRNTLLGCYYVVSKTCGQLFPRAQISNRPPLAVVLQLYSAYAIQLGGAEYCWTH